MRTTPAACALACFLLAASAAPAAGRTVQAGTALAETGRSSASLSNGKVERTWRIDGAGHVVTSALRAGSAGRNWSSGRSPDFHLSLAGVDTSSTSGWTLASVEPRTAGGAAELVFRYRSDLADGVRLERSYSLYPGARVIGVSSRLVNGTPAPLRIGAYSLDELTSDAHVSAEVQAYNGGSDWRDDYRHSASKRGSFDNEGEVLRLDDGTGRGWFLVSERRGSLMSRAGRDRGRTWVGVDNARDLIDYGPLRDQPPDYNRQPNPAYPAPVRQRTVAPLGSLELGRGYVGVYRGGEQGAAAAFASDFAAHEMAPFARGVDLNTFHPWGHGSGLSDANLRAQVDAAKRLGIETFMLDDQWQGGPGGESGDWRFDPDRFPDGDGNGTPDFVDYLHSQGLELGLWMSPVEFNGQSRAYAAHPDWACTPVGHLTAQLPDDAGLGVWDITNSGLRDYLSGVVDRLVSDYAVKEFKFDFQTWVDCPPHDYLDYEDAFVSWVREQEARHPNVTFELDETNDQRLWAFRSAALGPSWFDNGHLHGSTPQAKLLHDVWSAAPWLPPSTVGMGVYDGTLSPPYGVDYLLPIALLSHVTFWTDLTELSPDDAAETAWWIAWYRAHRDALAAHVYENTSADPLDGRSWAAFQPWRGGSGYLFAFRQSGGPETKSIRLYGVRATTLYRVTNVRTGDVLGTFSGSRLRAGLQVTLAQPYSAAVLSVEPA